MPTLTPVNAAGTSLATARIVAGSPDEVDDDTFARAYLLRVVGDRVEIDEPLPWPVYDGWVSSNGTSYYTCTDHHVVVGRTGAWRREPVGERGAAPSRIFGFSGADADADQVYVTSNRSLYVRARGAWSAHPFPDEVDMAFGLHGLAPDAIYVCTAGEGLHRWNGRDHELVEMPYAVEPSGVIVTAPDDLLVSADGVRLRRDGVWSTIEQAGKRTTIGVARLGDELFAGTREGVVRIRGDEVEVMPLGYCNIVESVGDAVIAGEGFEGTQIHVYQGGTWRSLPMPTVG